MLKYKKYLILIAGIAVIGIAVFIYFQTRPDKNKTYKLKTGDLEVVVNCKGEIRAKNILRLICLTCFVIRNCVFTNTS